MGPEGVPTARTNRTITMAKKTETLMTIPIVPSPWFQSLFAAKLRTFDSARKRQGAIGAPVTPMSLFVAGPVLEIERLSQSG